MSTLSKANRPTTHLWLIIFVFIFSLSPLLINITSVQGNYLYLFPLALFIIVNHKSIIIDLSLVFIALIIILFSFFPSIYFGAFRYLLIPIYFLITFPVIMIIKTKDWFYIISKISNILIIFEIIALISFLYIFFFDIYSASFCIENEDGRKNCLWGLTMTNSTYESSLGNIIRPSAIYDEPGTFSFIICMTTAIRYALGMNDKKTTALLSLGLITLSLAHYIFTFLYLLNRFFFGRKIKISPYTILISITVILICILFKDILSTLIFSRFEIIDGNFAGNNRSDRIVNTFSMISNSETFLLGIGPHCVLSGYECERSVHGFFDSNPFTLIAGYGVLLSMPYYGILLTYLYNFITFKDSFLMLGILLLLFIRPNTMSYGFALIAVLTLYSFLKKYSSKSRLVE
jgi:hypothetical protein